MTIGRLIPAALALAALASAIPASAADKRSQRAARGEAELARLIDGRTAGKPVECLGSSERRDLRIIDGTAFVFRDGDTLYVNRPAGANMLDWGQVPVFRLWGDQLCSKDMVELRDSGSRMPGAVLTMGEFVPYRRAG